VRNGNILGDWPDQCHRDQQTLILPFIRRYQQHKHTGSEEYKTIFNKKNQNKKTMMSQGNCTVLLSCVMCSFFRHFFDCSCTRTVIFL